MPIFHNYFILLILGFHIESWHGRCKIISCFLGKKENVMGKTALRNLIVLLLLSFLSAYTNCSSAKEEELAYTDVDPPEPFCSVDNWERVHPSLTTQNITDIWSSDSGEVFMTAGNEIIRFDGSV